MSRYALLAAPALTLTLALGGAQAQKVQLNFWTFDVANSPLLDKEIAAFEQANPNIEVVRTTTAGGQYTQTVNLAYRSGSAPDVLAIPSDGIDFKQVIANKWLLPLNKWATPAWQATFPKGSFVNGRNVIGGQVLTVPFGGRGANWINLYINNKVFRDAGLVDAGGKVLIPRTWAEQRRYAKQIVERSNGRVYGLGFAGKGGDFPLFTQAFSIKASGAPTAEYGYLNYKTGRFEYASNPVFKQWFDHWIGMKEDGSLYPQSISLNDEQIRPPFTQGAFGMYVSGPWTPNSLKSIAPDFTDYSVANLPMLSATPRSFYPETGGGGMYALSSQTKHPEEAWKFFAFLHSKASGLRWAQGGGGSRIWPETLDALTGKAKEVSRVNVSNVRLTPNFGLLRPQITDVKTEAVTPNFEYLVLAAFTGQLGRDGVQAALQKLQDDSNAALDRAIASAQRNGVKVTRQDFVFRSWNPLVDQTTAR